ncbi:MAG: TolC family protein [Planctomycetaceae bacterium]|jgi:cobalt-zinc-cadmium efflux system outer membrane protein|nr:TolC family protein [Planctomycetaceae bacterium]
MKCDYRNLFTIILSLQLLFLASSESAAQSERNNRYIAEKTDMAKVGVLGKVITLEVVRSEAILSNAALLQLRRKADAARGQWIQAGLKENPLIGYAADELSRGNSGKHGVQISQTIINKHKLTARQIAESKEFLTTQQRCAVQEQKVLNDAMAAAYRTAIAERKYVLLTELLKNSEEAYQVSVRLADGKQISRTEFLALKIQAKRTKLVLDDALIAYKSSSKILALLLGRLPEELLSIADDVTELPLEVQPESALAGMLQSSPQVVLSQLEIEAAKSQQEKEYAETKRDYAANISLLHNTETDNAELSFGVAVPLRIYNKNQGNIQRAKMETAAAIHNAERLRTLLSIRFQEVYSDYQSAFQRVKTYKNNLLSESQESFDLVLTGYKHGVVNSTELLNTQRTLISVRVEYLDCVDKFWEAYVLLQGSLLTGGLELP